jgi:ABC-type branched-subunit amino acid transport system permease subunit
MMNFLLIALVIGGIMLLAGAVVGLIIFVVQIGVITREANRPVHRDTSNYSLSQGREAGRAERNSDHISDS